MYQGLSSSASCCSACCSSLEHSLIAFVVVHDVTCVDVSPLINIVASAAVNERPLLLDETRLARRIDDEPVIAVDVDVDAVVVVVVADKPASSKITIICNTQISIFSPTTTKKKKKNPVSPVRNTRQMRRTNRSRQPTSVTAVDDDDDDDDVALMFDTDDDDDGGERGVTGVPTCVDETNTARRSIEA